MPPRPLVAFAAAASAGLLALATLAGAGCGMAQQPARIGSELPWTDGELGLLAVNNTLDRFHDAAARADFDAYFALWTGESVFLGTDATERWVGQEFRDFARPHFESGKGWTYRPRDRRVTMLPGNRAAFFDELLENDKLGTCRGSGILTRRGDAWKVLQYNLSIPIPNDLADEFARRIKAQPPPPAPPVAPRGDKPPPPRGEP